MSVGTPTNLTASLNTTDASSFATAAFTPTAGAKLLAWVNVGHRTITPSFPTSLSGHGVTWTKFADLTTSNNTWNCSLWEAVASGSPSSGTLTFNLGATAETCTWRVVEATGTQVVQSKPLTTSAADPSLTLDNAIGAGGVTLGFLMNNNATTTLTAGSGYTDIGTQQSSSTAPVFKSAVEYNMTGSTTVSYTAAGTVVRGMIGVELGPTGPTQYAASGTVAATSAAAGSATLLAVASAVVAAVTAVSGAATGLYPASGTVAAVSGASGTIGKLYPATGSTAAVSGTSGAATSFLPASGTVTGVSATSGAATSRLQASGTVAAVSGTAGSASVIGGPQQYPASGTTAAVSGATGSATALLTASGTVSATSGTTGAVTARYASAGSVGATSAAAGSATALYAAAGTVEAVSGASGSADVIEGDHVIDHAHATLSIIRSHATLSIARAHATLSLPDVSATLSLEE